MVPVYGTVHKTIHTVTVKSFSLSATFLITYRIPFCNFENSSILKGLNLFVKLEEKNSVEPEGAGQDPKNVQEGERS
jgi:hypothetical protein